MNSRGHHDHPSLPATSLSIDASLQRDSLYHSLVSSPVLTVQIQPLRLEMPMYIVTALSSCQIAYNLRSEGHGRLVRCHVHV